MFNSSEVTKNQFLLTPVDKSPQVKKNAIAKTP